MAAPALQFEVTYPESDGKPIADNTKQFRWITTIQGGLDALFAADPNVFVADDLLWYPVEGSPTIRTAPDVLVVFGRPRGHRGSYVQHREARIAPQVVFEVLSPGNTFGEMHEKRAFYERYGVEEYYLYDPDGGLLAGWLRTGAHLDPIVSMSGWVSPRLGVAFGLEGVDLTMTAPDGSRFRGYVELAQAREDAERRARQAEARAERLAARLRELGEIE